MRGLALLFVAAALLSCCSALPASYACGAMDGMCMNSGSCPSKSKPIYMGYCDGSLICCSRSSSSGGSSGGEKSSEGAKDEDKCRAAGGVCSNSCDSGSGGKWLTGVCAGSAQCCIGAGTTPVAGSSYATYFLDSHSAVKGNQPAALVYIPSSFDKNGDLNVVLFMNGQSTCLESAVRAQGDGIACDGSSTPSPSFGLIKQMEQAKPQAILILIDTPSSSSVDVGNLLRPNGLSLFFDEILSRTSDALGGSKTTKDVVSIQIFAALEGDFAAGLLAERTAEVPQIKEIVLLGAEEGYGKIYPFYTFVKKNSRYFGPNPTQYRFANVHNVATNSDNDLLLAQLKAWWHEDNHPNSLILNDDSLLPLPKSSYVIPIIFKTVDLKPADIAAQFLAPFVEATYGTSPSLADLRKTVKTELQVSETDSIAANNNIAMLEETNDENEENNNNDDVADDVDEEETEEENEEGEERDE